MDDQPRVATSNNALAMEGTLPDGLTAIHIAVIQDDRDKVRALLKSREYGANARSATGATPLMLASLFGRAEIFQCLAKNGAALGARDHHNHAAMDYVKGEFTRDLISRYQGIGVGEPCLSGRQIIEFSLRVFKYAHKSSRPRRRSATQRLSASLPSETATSDVLPAETPAAEKTAAEMPREEAQTPDAPSADPPAPDAPSTRVILLRYGKHLEAVEARSLAATQVDIVLGRKSTGFVRGKNEDKISKFAISGWTGINGQDVLDNRTYTDIVRRICNMYGFKLAKSRFDYRWSGDPSLKKGAYFCCHAEKQLGAWVLREALFQALGTNEITVENIARLKELSPQLPARLTETVIELDHKPCSSCINFLRLLRKKAGLLIEWKSRNWFVEGLRPTLQFLDDHEFGGDAKNSRYVFENEIDEDEDNRGFDDSSDTMDQEEDDTANTGATAEEGAATHSSPLATAEGMPPPRRQLRRHASDPYRKGHSPVTEPPKYKLPKYPNIEAPRPPPGFAESLRRFAYDVGNDSSRETSREYDVEKILDFNQQEMEYKVLWMDESVTYVPAENLTNCQKLVDDFWRANGMDPPEAR